MTKVKRYYVNLDHGTRYSPVDGCDQAMNKAEDFDRVTAERDALQQRLTAADERADVLDGLLREAAKDDDGEYSLGSDWHERYRAALKPAEGGGDDPS